MFNKLHAGVFRPLCDLLGFRIEKLETVGDHSLVVTVPSTTALETAFDQIRIATGSAPTIQEFDGKIFPGREAINANANGNVLVANDPVARVHDVMTHLLAWLALTDNIYQKLAERSSKLLASEALHADKPTSNQAVQARREVEIKHASRLDGIINSPTLLRCVEAALSGRPSDMVKLSEHVATLLGIDQEAATAEAENVLIRAKQLIAYAQSRAN